MGQLTRAQGRSVNYGGGACFEYFRAKRTLGCLHPIDHCILEAVGYLDEEVSGEIHMGRDIERGKIGRITMCHAMAPTDQFFIKSNPNPLH